MSSRLLLCISLVISLGLSVFSLAARADTLPALVLDPQKGLVKPGFQWRILEDAEHALSVGDVLSSARQADWVQSPKEVPSYGFSGKAYWLKVPLTHRSTKEQSWIFELDYAPMRDIDVYLLKEAADSSSPEILQHWRGGSGIAVDQRPMVHRTHVFPMRLPPELSALLLVRVSSDGSMTLPFKFRTLERFTDEVRTESSVLGIYFGFMLALMFYNLFIWSLVRDLSYLLYVGFMAGMVFIFISLNGTGQIYVWPEFPNLTLTLIPVSMSLAWVFGLAFTRQFLNTAVHLPRWNRFVWFSLYFAAIAGLLALLVPYSIAIRVAILAGFVGCVAMLGGGFLALRQSVPAARFYVLGWTLFLIASLMQLLRVSGVIPNNLLTEYSQFIGSALEGVLLSVALAARMRRLKEEKEIAQQQAIDNHALALKNQQVAFEHQQKALDSERKAVENLQRIDKLKDEFLANTSHELRTPLNGIIGLAEASLHQASERLSATLRENLQMIVISGRRLGSLVNDILDFSKLRHEDIVLSPKALDVRAMAEVVMALSRPLIGERHIRLINEMPLSLPLVWADENRVQQILHNLIGNALKFTREGQVSINAEVHNDRLVVAVTDTGIGIPEDRRDTIFESFNQGDGSVQREFGGTGLGLSITRKLVELHGGKIDVHSTVGVGSTFTFSLPLASDQTESAPALLRDGVVQPLEAGRALPSAAVAEVVATSPDIDRVNEGGSNVSHWILVVDDEPINRKVLRAQLGSAGFGVVEAADGFEALEQIRSHEHTFDLVLLDVMMPRLSGFDACATLRRDYPALMLPVIFLTAKSQTEDVLAGFAAGGNDYLVKPFSRDELLARIRIHLELITTHRIIRNYSKGLEEKVLNRTRELVDAQQQLVQKQKQAALGILTAGVAHEINNPNNFVQVALQNALAWKNNFNDFLSDLLSEEADPEIREAFAAQLKKLDEQLALIETGSQRIDSIVKGLRTITRLDESDQQHADVMEGLLQTIELITPSVSENVTFETSIQARPRMMCWPAELNQVFMNVLMNAVHAIEEKSPSVAGVIQVSSTIDGDKLRIAFVDNGIGMTADVLAHACDPFFTTREVGSGAGLGLSISRDIVLKHGGELVLTSEPGKGTQVIVLLPLGS